MKHFIILSLITLSVVFACHSSCNCDVGSNVCKSCKYESIGAKIDIHQRSCPCPSGWYQDVQVTTSEPQTITKFEFECKRLTNTDDQGNQIAVVMETCKLEIGLRAKDMKVLTDCHFENIDGKSFVISDVKLDVISANFNDACLGEIRTKIQYKSPINNKYIDLPDKYIINHPAGNKTIKIPLIDVFDLATVQILNEMNGPIHQLIELLKQLGHSDKFVRAHKWNLIIYTNRDQVEVFQIDVDVQETEGCQPGQECIIIADLDTVSNVYTDASFTLVHNPPHKYKVGDIFYAKIKFADPTYTKRLEFIKLYFKSESNKIFNFSSITNASWDGTGLRIALLLVEPSQGAVIQVSMKIITQNARFLVENEEEQTVKSSFIASINENPADSSQQVSNNKSNANILFGLSILSTVFILF